jgi:hypothetical protein
MMPVHSPLLDPCDVGPVWSVCPTGNRPRSSGRSVPSLGRCAGQGRGIELVDAGGNGRSAPAASHALAMGRGIGVRGDDRLWHATVTGTVRDLFAGDIHGSHKSMIGANNMNTKSYEVVVWAAANRTKLLDAPRRPRLALPLLQVGPVLLPLYGRLMASRGPSGSCPGRHL